MKQKSTVNEWKERFHQLSKVEEAAQLKAYNEKEEKDEEEEEQYDPSAVKKRGGGPKISVKKSTKW